MGVGWSGRSALVRVILEGIIFVLLWTGLFLFIPAIVFHYIEASPEWDYVDSVYFTFITLSTIGFGDMVAGSCPQCLSFFLPTLYVISGKNACVAYIKKSTK